MMSEESPTDSSAAEWPKPTMRPGTLSPEKTTHPEEAFEQTLKLARDARVDAITLSGDLFSFPSEAAIGMGL